MYIQRIKCSQYIIFLIAGIVIQSCENFSFGCFIVLRMGRQADNPFANALRTKRSEVICLPLVTQRLTVEIVLPTVLFMITVSEAALIEAAHYWYHVGAGLLVQWRTLIGLGLLAQRSSIR